jgi:hypothetical protein
MAVIDGEDIETGSVDYRVGNKIKYTFITEAE